MVTHFYPPVGGVRVLRTVKVAKYLSRLGFLPVVLTSKDYRFVDLTGEEPDDFSRILVRIPSPKIPTRQRFGRGKMEGGRGDSTKRLSSIKRAVICVLRIIKRFALYPDDVVGWIPSAYRAGLQAIRKHGVRAIYATHPPPSNLLVALMLSMRTAKPLIVDFRDLWRHYPFRVKYHPLELLLTPMLEAYLIRKAALVITVTTPLVRDFLKDHGRHLSGKLLYLPNGYDEEDFACADSAPKDPEGRFRIVHTGTLYPGRGGGYFLAGLRRALELRGDLSGRVIFRQVGIVDITEEELFGEFEGQGVAERLPHVGHSQAISEMLGADLLLLIVPRGRAGEVVLSLKTTEYLRAGKPILVISPPSPTGELVERLRAGRVLPHEDTEGIAQAIISFYDRRKEKFFADPSVFRWYERGRQMKRLAVVLKGMLGYMGD